MPGIWNSPAPKFKIPLGEGFCLDHSPHLVARGWTCPGLLEVGVVTDPGSPVLGWPGLTPHKAGDQARVTEQSHVTLNEKP